MSTPSSQNVQASLNQHGTNPVMMAQFMLWVKVIVGIAIAILTIWWAYGKIAERKSLEKAQRVAGAVQVARASEIARLAPRVEKPKVLAGGIFEWHKRKDQYDPNEPSDGSWPVTFTEICPEKLVFSSDVYEMGIKTHSEFTWSRRMLIGTFISNKGASTYGGTFTLKKDPQAGVLRGEYNCGRNTGMALKITFSDKEGATLWERFEDHPE